MMESGKKEIFMVKEFFNGLMAENTKVHGTMVILKGLEP